MAFGLVFHQSSLCTSSAVLSLRLVTYWAPPIDAKEQFVLGEKLDQILWTVSVVTTKANVANNILQYNFNIWPASCEKGSSDICKKCRLRQAAALETPDQGLYF